MEMCNEIRKLLEENANNKKEIILKKISLIELYIINKIIEIDKTINIEALRSYIKNKFSDKLRTSISSAFEHYQTEEEEYYNNALETVERIFKIVPENKTKVIYLENMIKKMENRSINAEQIFEYMRENNEVDIDEVFRNFFVSIQTRYNFLEKNKEMIREEIDNSKEAFKKDISKNMKQYTENNVKCSVITIVDEMDQQGLRGGKTRRQHLIDRRITIESKDILMQLLEKTVNSKVERAKKELHICSTNMIDLIFKLLPEEYHNQKQLLEIIVDTDINERIGNIIEGIAKKLKQNLQEKNDDIVENELYDVKRYKEHDEYKYNYSNIDKIYQDIVHEIRLAYDIPEEGPQAARLNFAILSEDSSTKEVLKKLINDISLENDKNVEAVRNEMQYLSNKNAEGKDKSK